MKRPPLRLYPHQQKALKIIASWSGVSLRDVPAPPTRFRTPHLASKLAIALQQKTKT